MTELTQIRNATAAEREALGELHRHSSYVWEADRANLDAHPDALGVAGEAIAEGRVRVAVSAGGELIGVSVVAGGSDGVCELDDLFVEPRVMRRGIGRALVEDAAARAVLAGSAAITVVAHPRNFAFCESVGFVRGEPVATRLGPAVKLRRELGGGPAWSRLCASSCSLNHTSARPASLSSPPPTHQGINVKSPLSRKLVIGTTGFVLLGRTAAGRLRQPRAEAAARRARRRGGGALAGQSPAGRGGVVAAEYLGINRSTLRRELDAGRSLTEIASSTPGRSLEGLRAAIMAAARERLAHAVANGWISGEEARRRLDDLPGRIDAVLERSWVGVASRGSGLGPFGRH